MDSEIKCLCNVASDRKIWLTLGSKRKSMDPTEINIGDWVTVSNHGNFFAWAQVKEIDFSKNLAKVKCEISCTTNVVEIANLQLYSTSATSKQKRIETDFFHHHKTQRYEAAADDEKLGDKQTVSEDMVPIWYYSLENTSKFCAEGLVKNLLHMLRLSEHDVSVFWDLEIAPLHSISKRLCYAVPKNFCNHFDKVNSIQKYLWILWKQFKFIATKNMKLSNFTSIKNTLQIIQICHFLILLSVNSKNAVYDHVVVIWQGRVIDYESENIYMLTKKSLQQIYGPNTLFSHVSCGYGLFPLEGAQAPCPEITNWRKADYDDKKSKIRSSLIRNKIVVCRKSPLWNYSISKEMTPISFWQYYKVFVSLISLIWKKTQSGWTMDLIGMVTNDTLKFLPSWILTIKFCCIVSHWIGFTDFWITPSCVLFVVINPNNLKG